ncbi:hypothetical protein [Agromyces silvae]|uniref:hypothetical protein n=1 Tax=Agromyces silvae TaxID=3388266 RepID=UPI00280A7F1C|nr:hypothetical protein [Agromyces protaetiae]
MLSDRTTVTEQQRRAHAALLNSSAESRERTPSADRPTAAEERRRVIEGLRRRWAHLQMQRLTEAG